MKRFTAAMALAVALAVAAAPTLAQGQTGAGATSGSARKGGSADSKSSDTMKSSGARGGAGMSRNAEQVKAVQQALKDQGHDPGDIDGMMGPKTRAALRDYQQKQGLKVTGRLDAETSAKLGVQKSSEAPSSTSPAASPGTSAPSADTKKSGDSKQQK